ncbi:MAG: nitrite reductase large subunit NirB [Spirochaetia bacterium]|nr:nitrite reductase large subunit NirB [Spirochaetia bacterium]
MSKSKKKKLLIVGNGMVSHRFCEKMLEYDSNTEFEISIFGEEIHPAYDRVHLSEYFSDRTAEDLYISTSDWYKENGIKLFLHDKVIAVDTESKSVKSAKGQNVKYDKLILATGSAPFVPLIDEIDKEGIFVYRTIDDLESIRRYAGKAKKAAVLGGGLLGLEAAKALVDLKLETHVIEFSSRLLPRQIDDKGSEILSGIFENMDVKIHTGKHTKKAEGNGALTGLEFSDGSRLDIDLLIISTGIIPRDNLAKKAGLKTGERGGIVVDDFLQTSNLDIYAVGEVALHNNKVYGLVGPGYSMADVLASNLCGKEKSFQGGDLSTKLKVIGVDVASFGDALGETENCLSVEFTNSVKNTYKKLILSEDGKHLLGGILIGDTSKYMQLLDLMKRKAELPEHMDALLLDQESAAIFEDLSVLSDDALVCSCNGVSRSDIVSCIHSGAHDASSIKNKTKAGSGCGGCMTSVQSILKTEMEKMGKKTSSHLCEHFPYSRQELFHIIKIKKLNNFGEVLKEAGSGCGCEICKPLIASLFASIYNDSVQDHVILQDTNDRFMANIQKGGTYSVVPRIPGGEITPEKLIVLGEVAKKFNLYVKMTGGQRVDFFGAKLEDLPLIWKDLVEAGFESGHAYGKAMRTVKSCAGSVWCRFGVQDSVKMAIDLEERYRGLRAPHKMKSGVSGCIRECAEAQSKDFGIIATEKGYNLYVCGNGGIIPQHAKLLASDIDRETLIKYIDRFLMYYIQTADKLTRTSTWLNNLEGGIEFLKDVVINDKLGICDQLEYDMQTLVDAHQCEWKRVVESPELQKRFRPFVNSDETDETIRFKEERSQKMPTLV